MRSLVIDDILFSLFDANALDCRLCFLESGIKQESVAVNSSRRKNDSVTLPPYSTPEIKWTATQTARYIYRKPIKATESKTAPTLRHWFRNDFPTIQTSCDVDS